MGALEQTGPGLCVSGNGYGRLRFHTRPQCGQYSHRIPAEYHRQTGQSKFNLN